MKFPASNFKVTETNKWFQLVPMSWHWRREDHQAKHPEIDFSKVLGFLAHDPYHESTITVDRVFKTHMYEPLRDAAYPVTVFRDPTSMFFYISKEQNDDLKSDNNGVKNQITQELFTNYEVNSWVRVIGLCDHPIRETLPDWIPTTNILVVSCGVGNVINRTIKPIRVWSAYIYNHEYEFFYKANVVLDDAGTMWTVRRPLNEFADTIELVDVADE